MVETRRNPTPSFFVGLNSENRRGGSLDEVFLMITIVIFLLVCFYIGKAFFFGLDSAYAIAKLEIKRLRHTIFTL